MALKQYGIYVDETNITNVSKPAKIVAENREKRNGHMTAAERKTLVRMYCGINGTGNFIPAFFPSKYERLFLKIASGTCLT